MQFNPSEMEAQDVYKLMAALVVPRPIGFTSTLNPDGGNNLAPFSFFMMITSSPPHIALSIGAKDGQEKDTLRNIRHSGEFVVNTVGLGIGPQMARTAVDFPPDTDEFEVSGLTPVPSDVVKPMRVLEAPANLECVARDIRPVGGPPYSAHLVIGEVVRLHVQDQLLMERNRIDLTALDAVGRLTGDSYCSTTDQYELKRS
ncbi:MAG TPA: flavin reductase family protein [Thermomicrobiales bacterium]|nr:flavin reductase family protein [Thermomicrobiales bacterium]